MFHLIIISVLYTYIIHFYNTSHIVIVLSRLCQFEVFDQFVLLDLFFLLTVVSLGFTCELLQDKVDLVQIIY